MSLKNIIHDIPEADAVDIGKEITRRMQSMFTIGTNERGYSTPYKDFIHHHMGKLNEIVVDAIAVPAGLNMENIEKPALKTQLHVQKLGQEEFSIVQWPKHLDFIRILDERHRLWKLDWKSMIPEESHKIIDTHQNVRAFQRGQIASLVAEKENHSMEEHKTAAKRFRGLTEYLLPASDRVISPHAHTDLLEMDRKHRDKVGFHRRLRNMIQPWKGARKADMNNNRGRSRSRSRSRSIKRPYRGHSVSPLRRKMAKNKAYAHSMVCPKNQCQHSQCLKNASSANATMDQSQLDASIADTTILSGQSANMSPTEALSSDKNVSFNVTGRSKYLHWRH